jgi:hypothetical protein
MKHFSTSAFQHSAFSFVPVLRHNLFRQKLKFPAAEGTSPLKWTQRELGTRNQALRKLIARCSLLIALLFAVLPVLAQDEEPTPDVANHTWEVFLERGIDSTGRDRLIFIDVLTGEEMAVEVSGERYTPTGSGVLFFDYLQQRVMLAASDGTVTEHPFIRLENGARRVDWIVSRDGRSVVWTLTTGVPNALTTVTTMATAEGANRRDILQDGPRDGVRAMPVSFSVDGTLLYMDMQPDSLGRFTAYTQYAGLFSVNLESGEPLSLPGEPACFCGAGLRADHFLRLTLTADITGFDVQVYDLARATHQTIPAVRLTGFTQAGDVLISPDGTQAVYALSQVQNFGAPNQSVETVFMHVDLLALTQEALISPITTYIHPVRWTEDNTAILFTSPQQSGTWKIDLTDRTLKKVAEAAVIGTLSD